MTNLLIEILNNITVSQWCFNYNGACSTCGMMDVKNELKKYGIDEIVESFENLDFEDREVQKYIVGLEKLFSLMTGPYTVWNDRNKIKELRELLKSKENDNPYIERLQASDYKTFWDNWSLQQIEWEKELEAQIVRAKDRREFESGLIKNDIEDRKNGLREKLIEKLNGMSSYDKLLVMVNDARHSPKFYPTNMTNQITDEDIKKLDSSQYNQLCSMFSKYIKGKTPWGRFRKRFIIR